MSAAVAITRLDQQPARLRRIAASSRDAAQARRLLALALVLEGASRAEAARQTGMDRQTLRDWVHRYNAFGVDGLVSRTAPGPRPKLTDAQMAELRQLVIDGPDPKIHKVIRWRCLDLQAEVAKRFSVTVDEGTIGKWLHKLELTRLQPRPYHPKKDADAQEVFKKTSAAAGRKPCSTGMLSGRSRFGFKTKPGSGRKALSAMSGHRSVHARRWCAITATTRPISSAQSARRAGLARRLSRLASAPNA